MINKKPVGTVATLTWTFGALSLISLAWLVGNRSLSEAGRRDQIEAATVFLGLSLSCLSSLLLYRLTQERRGEQVAKAAAILNLPLAATLLIWAIHAL